MNVLCSAEVDEFWLSVFQSLEEKYALKPIYWVGKDSSSRKPKNCFYQDVWEAFSLQGCVRGWESAGESFDLDQISRVEYYNYLKILDRVDGADRFTFSERDDLFKRQLNYWFFVLKEFKVGLVFFSNAPHLPYDYPLYLCAKKMNIKTLMFNVSSIAGWHYLTDEVSGRALSINIQDLQPEALDGLYNEAVDPFRFSKHEEPWYMQSQSKKHHSIRVRIASIPYVSFLYILAVCFYRLITEKSEFKSAFEFDQKYSSLKFYQGLYRKKKANVFDVYKLKMLAEKKRKQLKKEYDKYSEVVDSEYIGSYVYFALHYQPELTTTPLGGDASDQFYVIRELSRALPKGYRLIVKEHPSQFSRVLFGEQGRQLGCWELLSKLENVTICDMSVSSLSLIKNAKAVITVTGTVGWEAMVNEIPCLHFGGAWYQEFPLAEKAEFKNLAAHLHRAISEQSERRICPDDIEKYFGKNAIKNDIHGVLEGRVPRDPLLTAKYISLAINEL